MKMKDKRAKDKRSQQEHKDRIRQQRRKESDLTRRTAVKEEMPYILIVCEGENTEPDYFNHFRFSSLRVKAVGEGYNTVSLVERAEQLAERDVYDQVWCVFDKDDFSDENFNNAIRFAEAKGFSVGYSNQAFEYWLLLHFNDHQGGGMHRRDYKYKLNEAIMPFGITYNQDGRKHLSVSILELLDAVDTDTGKPRVKLAIQRAKRNHRLHKKLTPAKAESTTTVFQLVETLLKYI